MSASMKQLTKDIIPITLPTPFQVGPVNTYLIKGDALTLVDTGAKYEQGLNVLQQQLKEQNVTIRDIEVVVLTHHHPDHIGLLGEFLPHAEVYAHKKVRPWLKMDSSFIAEKNAFFEKLYKEHGVPERLIEDIDKTNTGYLSLSAQGDIDVELSEGREVPGLYGWNVIETPGHAQSHISLYRESDGVLIAGDHIIEHISSNAIIEAPYEGETERPKTLLQYRESLKKCRHVNFAYSGHGGPVMNPGELIENRLLEQDHKAKQFKNLMGDEPVTCFELCKKRYSHIYEKQPALTLSETLGHLDLLESRGEIKHFYQDGLVYYTAIS
ncbi:MBL fold metallo-hydrolase [Evansella clarkii]|uniref:MBL fold metallo-hydrolase n=1 Tax=Evansella clarkii TaxID=79879 RepID=UPI0009963490|nr:MBL fold metallo-hydrolase [Evansella clarkii]